MNIFAEKARLDQTAVRETDLMAALQVADLRVVLMCLFQATGDGRWLSSQYAPARDVRLVADAEAGFDAEQANQIRAAAAAVFAEEVEPSVPAPTGDLLTTMMSHCLGEVVAPEYAPMVAADLGFAPRSSAPDSARPSRPTALDAVVIGAGVSGLAATRRLLDIGAKVTVLEKHDDVGGTWLENTYPGCGVDTPNHFYSFSFAPNPGWTRFFSKRDEIQAYLRQVGQTHDLTEQIRFGVEVVGARWDARDGRWQIEAREHGRPLQLSCRALISATGHFNQPRVPPIDGLEGFVGRVVHTASWPEDLDLSDRRVAVIGTGASAMQLVPTIADQVRNLQIYQRTAQWVRPVDGYDQPVDPAVRRLFADIPNYGRWYRLTQMWRYGDGLLRFLRKDPEWPHPAKSVNRVNDRHRQEMTDFITAELADRPDLIDKCVPDYPPFGKRILIDNGWYRTLRRDDVELITDPIVQVGRTDIQTRDGTSHATDLIVFATGFNVTDLAARIDIRGVDGRRLADDWADGNPTAYLGMAVPGFPNFFVMYGPNTNMGHGGSGMWLAETQSDYIAEAVRRIDDEGLHALDVREDARTRYTASIDELHERLVWTHPGMSTYYRNAAGQVRSPMPFRLVDYWHMTRQVDPADYSITSSPQPTETGEST